MTVFRVLAAALMFMIADALAYINATLYRAAEAINDDKYHDQ